MIKKIGLISDTHIPVRWRDIPPSVHKIFADVDLILHAGDIGELWVLDKLSAIAPVIAVHGNDDSADSIRELPNKQIITIGGQRILLWHSHVEDRPTELAFRTINAWHPKLNRLAMTAKRAGASIVVYGHTHIAMRTVVDDVLIINPGAIASGNMFTRPLGQSVAILTIQDGNPTVEHFILQQLEQVWTPPFDLDAGFEAAYKMAEETIISAELQPLLYRSRNLHLFNKFALNRMLQPLSFACWEGKMTQITKPMLLEVVENNSELDPRDKKMILDLLHS